MLRTISLVDIQVPATDVDGDSLRGFQKVDTPPHMQPQGGSHLERDFAREADLGAERMTLEGRIDSRDVLLERQGGKGRSEEGTGWEGGSEEGDGEEEMVGEAVGVEAQKHEQISDVVEKPGQVKETEEDRTQNFGRGSLPPSAKKK